MPQQRPLTVVEAARAIGMSQTGCLQRDVGTPLGVSHSLIEHLLKRFEQTISVKQTPRRGRLKVSTVRQDRQISLLAKRIRMSSAVSLNRDLAVATRKRISTQTL